MIEQVRTSLAMLPGSAKMRALRLGVLVLLNSMMEALSLGLIFLLIKLIGEPERIHHIGVLSATYDRLGFTSERNFLITGVLFLVGAFLFKSTTYMFMVWHKSKFATEYEAEVSKNLFERYLTGRYTEVSTRNSAELITNIANRVFSAINTTVMGLITIVSETLVVVAIIGVLLVLEPMITLVAAVFLAGTVTLGTTALRGTLMRLGHDDVMHSERFLKALKEGFDGLKEIKVSGREGFFVDRYGGIRAAQAAIRRVQFTLQETPRVAIEYLVVVGMLAALLIILLEGRDTSELLGVLTLFGVAAFRIMPSTNRILFALNHIQSQRTNVALIARDFRDVRPQFSTAGGDDDAPEIDFECEIRLSAVAFSYPNGNIPALDGVNMAIGRGEKVGIVGPSGAGKSTLANLIMCLHAPDTGTLCVDRRDVWTNPRSWQGRIGYVPQSIRLADDTVRRNVALGVADEAIDDDRLVSVLDSAGIGRLVAGLPQGLDSMLGENGAKLSGGQAQRIAIARALYTDPEVLILDEATSALDLQTEREIAESIESIFGEKTLIIIAHRLSTVRNCDRLFMMEAGRVVDSGNFDELIERNAEFRELVRLMHERAPHMETA